MQTKTAAKSIAFAMLGTLAAGWIMAQFGNVGPIKQAQSGFKR